MTPSGPMGHRALRGYRFAVGALSSAPGVSVYRIWSWGLWAGKPPPFLSLPLTGEAAKAKVLTEEENAGQKRYPYRETFRDTPLWRMPPPAQERRPYALHSH